MLLVLFACAEGCSTWFHPSAEHNCSCGHTLGTVVVCNNETREVGVLRSYCITSNGTGSETSVVGRCLVALHHGEKLLSPIGIYNKVWQNITEQDGKTCGYLNRQGQLCGKCEHDHFVSAYSYDLKCHNCTSTLWSGVVKYLCVAFFPLTVFLCVVIVFHISVTSPAMNAPVLVCQFVTMPIFMQVLLQYLHDDKTLYMYYIKLLATVYGIWSLDFFRVVIPPICLPLNTMHIIALDYLVAVYPLFMLMCVYILLTAHDRGCRLVVRLWRPFLWCTTRLRQSWNIRHSIIDAFATFLLLSYIKLLNTSCNLLLYTSIHNDRGLLIGHFLYYDATMKFLGSQHMPFAILAILVLLVGILFPLLLLLLYPMQWFQKCLNNCHLNSPGLQIFMECFQGYYCDRTDGGWECRYFAAVYPALRVAIYVIYTITFWYTFQVAFIFLCLFVMVTVLLVRPYKTPCALYNKFDAVMIILVVAFTTSILEIDVATDTGRITSTVGVVTASIVATVPIVYFTIKVLQLLKVVLLQNMYFCHFFHDFNNVQRKDYKDLSATDSPLDSVN